MSKDRLPDDPFRLGRGPLFDDMAEAALIWSLLFEMSIEEAGTAVRALDVEDLRTLVLERVVCTRLRFDFERDGSVSFERDDVPKAEPGDDGPKGASK